MWQRTLAKGHRFRGGDSILRSLTEDLLSYVSRVLAGRNTPGLECRLAVYFTFSNYWKGTTVCVDGVSTPYKVLYLNVA
jgi:hypothetical protein